MDICGLEVEVVFLVDEEIVLAYAWHHDEKRALNHLEKIRKFHDLGGEIRKSEELEEWLKRKVEETVLKGARFSLPNVNYRNRSVYENILKIPRGKTATYAQIAKESNVKYAELLVTLMRNPFQVLIPCHRLVTSKGTLFGFYPLGKEVKRKLLELEGVKLR